MERVSFTRFFLRSSLAKLRENPQTRNRSICHSTSYWDYPRPLVRRKLRKRIDDWSVLLLRSSSSGSQAERWDTYRLSSSIQIRIRTIPLQGKPFEKLRSLILPSRTPVYGQSNPSIDPTTIILINRAFSVIPTTNSEREREMVNLRYVDSPSRSARTVLTLSVR